MPIYEYECDDCKKRYSITGSYSVLFSYIPQCPHCLSKNLKKKIGNISVIFKGSGFYKTDNKSRENTS